MYKIDPNYLRLAREFKANPIGHHSPDLQRLLRVFRSEPVEGKYALLCTKANREWMLVQLSGERGRPLTFLRHKVFTDLRRAEWEVFKLRWKKHTGRELAVEEEER
jgi:branched-chain amino acid transport system permease protein